MKSAAVVLATIAAALLPSNAARADAPPESPSVLSFAVERTHVSATGTALAAVRITAHVSVPATSFADVQRIGLAAHLLLTRVQAHDPRVTRAAAALSYITGDAADSTWSGVARLSAGEAGVWEVQAVQFPGVEVGAVEIPFLTVTAVDPPAYTIARPPVRTWGHPVVLGGTMRLTSGAPVGGKRLLFGSCTSLEFVGFPDPLTPVRTARDGHFALRVRADGQANLCLQRVRGTQVLEQIALPVQWTRIAVSAAPAARSVRVGRRVHVRGTALGAGKVSLQRRVRGGWQTVDHVPVAAADAAHAGAYDAVARPTRGSTTYRVLVVHSEGIVTSTSSTFRIRGR